MASQEEEEEAVPLVVTPGGVDLDEEVKKVESRAGEFPVNEDPLDHSFNSRISTDVDVAESQVAVAGSVDSAAEVSAVGAGVEKPSARVDHHARPASSGEVVDATEKVESWDLSEAVQEGAASKEDSKPNFSEDGTVEESRSSDLMADAPTSAASVEDSVAADVEEKKGEGRSDEDVGAGREAVSPAEVAVTEDGSPKLQDEGSAKKGDSEAPEASVEEVQKVGEATTSAEPEKEGASVEVEPSPSADVEEKAVDVEEKAVAVEDKSVDVEDKSVDVEDEPADVADKSVEVKSEDAGLVSEELPAEDAASVEGSPKILDQGSTGKGDSEAPEAHVEEVNEIAKATTAVEPDEAVASLEAVPSLSADVEEKFIDVEDKSVDVEDKPVDVEDKPIDVADKSDDIEVQIASATDAPVEDEVHEDAEAISGAQPDEAGSNVEAVPSPSVDVGEKSVGLDSADAGAVSEDVSPKIKDEESAEKVDSDAPESLVKEVHEVAEATSGAEPAEAGPNVEAVSSPSVDVEEKSVELDSADAGAVSENVSPKIEDEEKVDSEASNAPVKDEVHEVAETTTTAEPDEAGPNVEAVPSPSVDVEEKSVELDSANAGAVSEDVSPKIDSEESAEKFGSNAPEPLVEDVHEVTSDTKPDEAGSNVEAVPSPSVDVEEKSVELDSADAGAVDEDVSPRIEDEESAEKVDSEAPEPLVEEVHEVAKAATGAEPPEEVSSSIAVPSPSVDVEEKSFELDSSGTEAVTEDDSTKMEGEESAEKVDIESPSSPVEDEVHEVAEATTSAEPDEAVANVEAVPSSSVDVEEKSVELDSDGTRAVSEDVSPKIEDESTDNGDIEATVGEQVHEVPEARTSTEPDEANVEAVPSLFDGVEEKSFDLDSVDAGAVSEGVSPEIEAEGSAEKVDREAPEVPVKDAVHELAEGTSAKPDEAVSSVEAVSVPSVDVEDNTFELNSEDAVAVSEDVSSIIKDEESTDKVDSEAPEPHEVAEEINGAEPAEEVSSSFSVPSTSVDVEEKSFELDLGDSTPAEDVENKSVQGADSKDTSEVLPPESTTDKEDISPEPLAEGIAGSETFFVPDEEVHEVVEETISAESGEVPVEPESAFASSDVEDRSVDVNSEDAIGMTATSESVDKEGVSPETSSEATISAGADASLESEGSASLESLSSPANNVEDGSLGVNPEDSSEAKIELDTENTNKDDLSPELPAEGSTDNVGSADKEGLSPELPTEGSADNVGSESLFTPVEEVHEVIEQTISPELDEGSTSLESGPASDDVEEKPEDLSEATTAVQPLESVDKELVSRDLPVEEIHASAEEIGKFEDAATGEESTVLESAVASSEDVQSLIETKSRGFNFNDLKESLTTSEKEETATGEEGSSSDAVARDSTPLDASSPPPADEKKESPNSYDLHEEAVHLEEAAEKTLQDVKSGDKDASVAQSVAQIVLDESHKTGDSSELISGVIQHVAQLAQDDFQSDPNVLPDTVNQVFDRESAGSPANEGSQPKESSSLGTKFSLFVIWCISLCASHVSSKDMPAPALKLGAEEVAAVLHSNSQGAASSKAASSV